MYPYKSHSNHEILDKLEKDGEKTKDAEISVQRHDWQGEQNSRHHHSEHHRPLHGHRPVPLPEPIPIDRPDHIHRPMPLPEPIPIDRPDHIHRPVPLPEPIPIDRPHHIHRPVPLPEPIPIEKAPSFRPPRKEPRREFGLGFTDTHTLRRCQGGLAFLWLRNGRSHWMYITYVGPDTVYGYTWTFLGWRYTSFDSRVIDMFYCY